jgi:hypothetical protein
MHGSGKRYSKEELKDLILSLPLERKTFRQFFKDDIQNIMACYAILEEDPIFYALYKSMFRRRLAEIEEDILLNADAESVPTMVDRNGNEDLAPGHLRKAEMLTKTKMWVLERRNKDYQSKSQQDITTDGKQLGCVIIPSKDENE